MQNNKSLGNLNVDLNANLSGLKRGMSQAQSVVKKGVGGMNSALNGIKRAAVAFLAVMGIQGIGRMLSSMAQQAKKLAVLENTFKKLNKSSTFTFKSMELGMLNLARITGVSTADQTAALQQLMNQLGDLETPQNIQSILLPLALDWSAASGKDAKEAAKDIADAFLGELPEDFKYVKIKYEAETGKKFDDLTNAQKWQLVYKYLQQFKGSAEAAGNTLGGSFDKVKVGLEEVFKAMMGSQNFDPLIGLFQRLSTSLFDLAERIKSGDIPPILLAIQDALVKLFDALAKVDWEGAFTWLGDNWQAIFDGLKALALGLVGLKVAKDLGPGLGLLSGILKVLGEALKWIGGIAASIVGGMFFWNLARHFMNFGATLSGMEGAPKILRAIGSAMNKLAMSKVLDVSALVAQQSAVGAFFATMGKTFNPKEVATITAGLSSLSGGFSLFIQSVKMDGFIGAVKNLPTIFGLVGTQASAGAAVLGVSAATIAAILAAIVVAVVAFIAAWKGNWDGLRDKTKETWDQVKATFADVWNTSLKPIFDKMAEAWNGIANALAELGIKLPQFGEIWSSIWEAIKTNIGSACNFIVDTLGFALKTLGNLFGLIVELVKGFIALFIDPFVVLGKTLVAVLTGDFDAIGKLWTDWLGNLSLIFGNIIQYLGNFVGDFIQWIADFFAFFITGLANIIAGGEEFRENVRKWGERVAQTFKDWGNNLIKWIKDFFGIHSPSKLMADLGDNIGAGLINGILEAFKKFADCLLAIATFFADVLLRFGNWIIEIGKKGLELAAKIGELPKLLAEKFVLIVSSFTTGLSNAWTTFNEWTGTIGSKAKDFIGHFTALPGQVKDAMSSLASGITERMKDAVGSVSTGITNMLSAVSNMLSRFREAGKGLITAMWDGIRDKIDSMIDWIQDKMQDIRDLLPGSDAKKGPLSTLTKAGRGLVTAMQGGVEQKIPGFLDTVHGLASDVADALPTADSFGIGMQPTSMAMASSGASIGGNTIILQLNDGVFADERSLDNLVDKVNRKLGAINRVK